MAIPQAHFGVAKHHGGAGAGDGGAGDVCVHTAGAGVHAPFLADEESVTIMKWLAFWLAPDYANAVPRRNAKFLVFAVLISLLVTEGIVIGMIFINRLSR